MQSKIRKFTARFLPVQILGANIAGHLGFDGLHKAVQLIGAALGDDLNPPVREVTDESFDLKAAREPTNGIAKADALDPTGIVEHVSFLLHGRLTLR